MTVIDGLVVLLLIPFMLICNWLFINKIQVSGEIHTNYTDSIEATAQDQALYAATASMINTDSLSQSAQRSSYNKFYAALYALFSYYSISFLI